MCVCVSVDMSVNFIRYMNAYVDMCNSFADLHYVYCLICFRTNWLVIADVKYQHLIDVKDDIYNSYPLDLHEL